jgi:hypothetical protein
MQLNVWNDLAKAKRRWTGKKAQLTLCQVTDDNCINLVAFWMLHDLSEL